MSFLQELALNKQLVIAKQDQETLACVSKIFKAANGILIRLGGKAGRLGESIVGTAFLEGILLALDCLHINDVDISKIFKAANGILIRLGGKAGRLGESIVGTAFLEGILLALDCLHINDVDIS